MAKIITLCGNQGSGKDTVAGLLQHQHGFVRESFANSLKDAVAAVFNWDRELLSGDTIESRNWREEVDSWWANRLHIPELTPRWVLQYWGTEVCRYGFNDEIWIASLENRLLKYPDNNIVVSDCRFNNEYEMIKKSGGIVIYINRDNTSASNHISDHSLPETGYDYSINNNGSILHLHNQIQEILTQI